MHKIIHIGHMFQTYESGEGGVGRLTFEMVEDLEFEYENIFIFVLFFDLDGHVLLQHLVVCFIDETYKEVIFWEVEIY